MSLTPKSNVINKNNNIRPHIITKNENAEISLPRVWGPTTWMLFHCIAEKIKPEYFDLHKNSIIEIIYNIISCLPCPYCREDAVKTFRSFNFNTIKSKDDLKLFLFDFHNSVNNKLYTKQQEISILDKYKSLDIIKTAKLWTIHFKRYGIESREFMESMQRENIKHHLKKYLIANRNSFY